MKKYIGVKLIEAEPMTETEFKGLGDSEHGIDKTGRSGYKVVYPDGYVSWSPKDVFEEAYKELNTPISKLHETSKMMNSADYKERFKAEYLQLKIRMQGLEVMLKKYKAGTLNFTPSCSYDLLNGQFKAMDMYASYLEERAEIENIQLD